MKAPDPHFTSNTSAWAPSANFLDMMLAVMSGIGLHGARHVAQRVHPPVRGNDRLALADHGEADLLAGPRGTAPADRSVR